MAKVLVVTSGKGGVGKTTSTAALGAALAQGGEKVVVVDFDVGLRNLDLVMGAERRVVYDLINVVQGDAKLAQALIRDKRLENLSLLPASQTRDKDALTGRRRRARARRTAREVRLGHLRQPGGHRAGRHARDAPRRRRRRRDESRGLLGPRFRPHHRPARFEDRKGGEGRADRQAPSSHPLRSDPRRARRDAQDRGRSRDPVDPAPRHHPRERRGPEGVEPRRAGDAQQPDERTLPRLSRRRPAAEGRERRHDDPESSGKGSFGKLFGRRAA